MIDSCKKSRVRGRTRRHEATRGNHQRGRSPIYAGVVVGLHRVFWGRKKPGEKWRDVWLSRPRCLHRGLGYRKTEYRLPRSIEFFFGTMTKRFGGWAMSWDPGC